MPSKYVKNLALFTNYISNKEVYSPADTGCSLLSVEHKNLSMYTCAQISCFDCYFNKGNANKFSNLIATDKHSGNPNE